MSNLTHSDLTASISPVLISDMFNQNLL
jgi:hypothetical protein